MNPKPNKKRRQPMFESLESRQLMSTVSPTDITIQPASAAAPLVTNTTLTGHTVSQIKTAYGITGTGAGQTIAIVDAYGDPNLAADLSAFDSKMGLGTAALSIVSETGSSNLPASNAGWDLETSLDVEWAHAIAPSANLLLVQATTSNLGDLLTGVNYARHAANVSVVSMSWGSNEFFGETSYDSYFTTPTGHTNVTFVAASGDDGYVEWPSVSPNVIAVGGTTLNTAGAAGTYSSESAWADSGGGFSQLEPEPSYQFIVQRTGVRTTPDVSLDANVYTGYAVYDSVPYDGQSGWFEIGGTSAGAPQWAGLIALADQSRAAAGQSNLNTLSVLTALYDTAQTSSTYAADFHDITSGFGFGFGKVATPGYDLLTGLGSPKAPAVVTTLLDATITTTTSATITATPARPAPRPAFKTAAADLSITSTASTTVFPDSNETDFAEDLTVNPGIPNGAWMFESALAADLGLTYPAAAATGVETSNQFADAELTVPAAMFSSTPIQFPAAGAHSIDAQPGLSSYFDSLLNSTISTLSSTNQSIADEFNAAIAKTWTDAALTGGSVHTLDLFATTCIGGAIAAWALANPEPNSQKSDDPSQRLNRWLEIVPIY
jgi:subtilase family serine protease